MGEPFKIMAFTESTMKTFDGGHHNPGARRPRTASTYQGIILLQWVPRLKRGVVQAESASLN